MLLLDADNIARHIENIAYRFSKASLNIGIYRGIEQSMDSWIPGSPALGCEMLIDVDAHTTKYRQYIVCLLRLRRHSMLIQYV